MVAEIGTLSESWGPVARHASRRTLPGDADELRVRPTVVQQLLKRCRTVAAQLVWKPVFVLDSAPVWINFGQIWPASAQAIPGADSSEQRCNLRRST